MPTQLKVANRSKFVAEALLGGCGNAAGGTTCPPQGGQGHSPGTPLVPFVVKRKEPRVWAGQAHWWVLGLPAGAASPAKAPGVGGAERPPRNKHTPGTARQAVGARTKPMRESGAASCRREMGAGSACRREGKAKIKKEPGRESGAASCRRELRPGSALSDRISAIKCPLRERKAKTKSRAQNANCVQAQPGGGGEGN